MSEPTSKPKRRAVAATETAPARRYFLVNPKGAIHEADREHCRERLKVAGWRLATAAEIQALEDAGGEQRFDRPICAPWSPDPDAQLETLEG
jgi:hypothetical protein